MPTVTETQDIGSSVIKWNNIYAKKFVGPLNGNADTATSWLNAQKVYVTLGTASTTSTIQGGSSSAQTIGVDGILKIANGGTNASSFTKDCVIVSDGATTPSLVSRGLKVTGATTEAVTLTTYTSDKSITLTTSTSTAAANSDITLYGNRYFYLSCKSTAYITNGINSSLIFRHDSSGTITEYARFNSKAGLVLNSTSLPTGVAVNDITDKLYVCGTSRFTDVMTIYRESTTAQNYPSRISFFNKDTTTGQTQSTAFIGAYNTHAANNNGMNLVITSAGVVFIGGGESASNLYNAIAGTAVYDTEQIFITSDNNIYLEGSCSNTIANRKGAMITGGNIIPSLAGVKRPAAADLGAYDASWRALYVNHISVTGDSSPYITFSPAESNEWCDFEFCNAGYESRVDCGLLLMGDNGTDGPSNTWLEIDGELYVKSIEASGNLTVSGTGEFIGNVTMNAAVSAGALTAASLAVNGNTTLNNTTNSSSIVPHATNTYSLGISGNRYSKVFIGTADTYGGAGTAPIYWNAGVPAAISNISLEATDTSVKQIGVLNSKGGIKLYAAASGNHGLYSNDHWVLYENTANTNTYIRNWANKGTLTQPIYFDANGEPQNTSYSLSATIDAGTAPRLSYYKGANEIAGTTGIVYKSYNSTVTGNRTTAGTIRGLIITGTLYGNNAAYLASANVGEFAIGDPGPQLMFGETEGTPKAALIYTNHNGSGLTGSSIHFVTDEGPGNFVSDAFVAKNRITIGQTKVNTTYALHVTGTTYITGITTLASTSAASSTETGALRVSGGVGIKGQTYLGDTLTLQDNVVFSYNSTDHSLDIVIT